METITSWLVNKSEDFQFVLYFGLLFLIIVVEQFLHFRKIEKGRRWKANYTLTILAIISMLAIPFTFISAAKLAEEKSWGLFTTVELNRITLGFITLILRGFISFFTHLLAHKVPLFWRVHRVHHLDTAMDVSTTVRVHPFEFIINSIIGLPFIMLFGFPVWGLMLYELFDIVITLFSHSNTSLPKSLEKIVRYFIVTPDLHRIHHSSHQPETDSNYSAVFPIWDVIFGTFRTKTQVPQVHMELGLEEVRDIRTKKPAWLLLSPFISFHKMKKNEKDL